MTPRRISKRRLLGKLFHEQHVFGNREELGLQVRATWQLGSSLEEDLDGVAHPGEQRVHVVDRKRHRGQPRHDRVARPAKAS